MLVATPAPAGVRLGPADNDEQIEEAVVGLFHQSGCRRRMTAKGQLLPLRGGWRTGSCAPIPAIRVTAQE